MMRLSIITTLLLFHSLIFAQSVNSCEDKEYEGTVYKVVEQMPSFHSCEHDGVGGDVQRSETSISEVKKCSHSKLNDFLVNHDSYKKMVAEFTPKGRMLVSYVVEQNGCLSSFNVRRDVCDGCGDIVIGILKTLPRYNPGTSKKSPVRVMQSSMFSFQ